MPKIANLNQQEVKYIQVLAKVIELFHGKSFVTVRDIAAEMGCTWEGAQRRIHALKKRGCRLRSTVSKHGVSGAPPRCYQLVPNKASKKILDVARRAA